MLTTVPCYISVGAATGVAFGTRLGLASGPFFGTVMATKAVFKENFINEHSPNNFEKVFLSFVKAQLFLPLAGAIAFGLTGAAYGAITGIAKEVLFN